MAKYAQTAIGILLAISTLSCAGWPNYHQQLNYLEKRFNSGDPTRNLLVERRVRRPVVDLHRVYSGVVPSGNRQVTIEFVARFGHELIGKCAYRGAGIVRRWICHAFLDGKTLWLLRPQQWCFFCRWDLNSNKGFIYRFTVEPSGKSMTLVGSARIEGAPGQEQWAPKTTPYTAQFKATPGPLFVSRVPRKGPAVQYRIIVKETVPKPGPNAAGDRGRFDDRKGARGEGGDRTRDGDRGRGPERDGDDDQGP